MISLLAHAGCDGLAEKLNASLYRIDKGIAKDLSFNACKVWPFDPSKTIVVLAHRQESNIAAQANQDNSDGIYDLTVLLVNSNSDEVINQLFQKSVFTSDAIRLNNIVIDTAAYNLGKNLRAFGVKAMFATVSSVGSWEHSQIALYVPQGNKFKVVLGRLVVTNKIYQQEDDCIEKLTDISRTLSIADTSNFGHADLLLKEMMVVDEGKREENDCKVSKKISSKNYALRFNGESYAVPGELQY